MKRRDFITLIGGAAAARQPSARAQKPTPLIGLVSSRSPHIDANTVSAIQEGGDVSTAS